MTKLYRPSFSTEGEAFIAHWCGNCQRDKAMREGAEIEDCDDDEVCPILAASFAGPVKQWVRTDNGPRCLAYVEAGQTIPPEPCPHTTDLFA